MNSDHTIETRTDFGGASSKAQRKSDLHWDWVTWFAMSVVLVILMGAVYGLWKLISLGLTASNLERPVVKVAISALLLVGAIVLYAIKKSAAQPIYGLAEVAVGLVANWHSLGGLAKQLANAGSQDPSGSQFTRLAVLGGGLYLIGRGIANIAEGGGQPSSTPSAPKQEGAETS